MNKHYFRWASVALAALVAFTIGDITQAGTQFSLAATLAWAIAPMLAAMPSLRGHYGNLVGADIAEQLQDLSRNLSESVTKFQKSRDELTTRTDDYLNRLEKGEKVTAEVKTALDEVLIKANEQGLRVKTFEEQLREISQKMDEREKARPVIVKSMGQQFVESEKFKAFKENGFVGSARVEIPLAEKQVTTTSAGGLMSQPYQDSLVSLERQRLRLRDLLTVIPVTSSSVEYARQTTRTNAAAPVAEGAAKPYSDYAWDVATAPIRTLAHLAKITRQAAEDAPRLMAEVESEMRYGLALVEENQILNGSGTGQNLNGIMTQATAFNQAANLTKVDDVTAIDVIRMALLQNVLAGAPADGIVLNPVDWALIELTKTTDGAYLMANPQGQLAQNLWRIPVVDSVSMTVDNFLVGAFKYGANLYDRMAVEVLLSSENADDFEKNLMTMRCEERIGLGVKRTYAFTKGVFSTLIAAANA